MDTPNELHQPEIHTDVTPGSIEADTQKQHAPRKLFPIALVCGVFLLVGFIAGYVFPKTEIKQPKQVACTMEAKICPDGSSVGRSEPNCEFAPCPTTIPSTHTLKPSTIQPSQTPEPTVSLVKIPVQPTTDWKSVQNGLVGFKIPPQAKCNSNAECTEITYPNIFQGTVMPIPARITVDVVPYTGFSRREQFLTLHSRTKECKPIFVDSIFGKIPALQIAIDGGWCQGGYEGGIVAAVGKTLVIFGPGLYYDSHSIITRWDILDTIVSTLHTIE